MELDQDRHERIGLGSPIGQYPNQCCQTVDQIEHHNRTDYSGRPNQSLPCRAGENARTEEELLLHCKDLGIHDELIY